MRPAARQPQPQLVVDNHPQAAGVYRLIDLDAAQAEHHTYRRHMQYLDHGAYIGKAAGWAQKPSKPTLDDITQHADFVGLRSSAPTYDVQ